MGSESDHESSLPSTAGATGASTTAAGIVAGAVPTQSAESQATPIAASPGASGTTRPRIPRPRQLNWNRVTDRQRRTGAGRSDAPRLRQLMGVCGWAAVLGGIGLIIGLRGQIGILTGEPPTWYEPSLIGVGIVGILLTVAAFLTVNRRRAPWIFLSSSSVALIVAMSLTSSAF